IIVDSCTDLTPEMKEDKRIVAVPLNIQIGDKTIVDDETFNQEEFLKLIKESNETAKTACPSPDAYMQEMKGEEDVFVVTLSGNLSGSFNSAQIAKDMYIEKWGHKNIEVINSCSASVAQTLITKKLVDLISKGLDFNGILEELKDFRANLKTKFVLEDLSTLAKNGRLTRIQSLLVSVLNIKPILAGTADGHIEKLGQARGFQKALKELVKLIEKDAVNAKDRILGIAHCNNYKKAMELKDMIFEKVNFKDYLIVDTAGISSTYANNGGIIVSY
ncbi:MAG: DegV family protein, partial [Clostridiales bacterium]|nr:DegV family protein [Clostridiales bacterium]